MTDNDQAAVEALCKIKHEIRGRSAQGTWSKEWGIGPDGARAILDAIRKGEVPGVWCQAYAEPIKDEPPGETYWRERCREHQSRHVARDAERDALRAEVERLKSYAEAADKALELACQTRNAAVDATQVVCLERDRLRCLAYVEGASTTEREMRKSITRDFQKVSADRNAMRSERDQLRAEVEGLTKACNEMEARADHNAEVALAANVQRDRLAGLLRRIRSGIWRLNEDGWRIEGGGGLKPGEIDAALAEVK